MDTVEAPNKRTLFVWNTVASWKEHRSTCRQLTAIEVVFVVDDFLAHLRLQAMQLLQERAAFTEGVV